MMSLLHCAKQARSVRGAWNCPLAIELTVLYTLYDEEKGEFDARYSRRSLRYLMLTAKMR